MDGNKNTLREAWDQRHREAEDSGQLARVLEENIHLISRGARILDLACGRGANALWLARLGFNVSAWDLSAVAIERLERSAIEQGIQVMTEVRDVIRQPPDPESFDVILVGHFLDRGLTPAIGRALRPGGLLFYQTFSRCAVSDAGPSSTEFRLDENELLELFPDLRVRVYREERRLGDTTRGWRDLAMLVAEKSA
jgi:tellurite methyltransferase